MDHTRRKESADPQEKKGPALRFGIESNPKGVVRTSTLGLHSQSTRKNLIIQGVAALWTNTVEI